MITTLILITGLSTFCIAVYMIWLVEIVLKVQEEVKKTNKNLQEVKTRLTWSRKRERKLARRK